MSGSEDFIKELEASGMSLQDQSDKIAERMAAIRTQIATAQVESKEGIKPLDRSWRVKAKHALQMFGIEHQRILKKCGEANRAERRNGSESYGQRFIAAAKRRLQTEVYDAIVEEAEEDGQTATDVKLDKSKIRRV